MKHLARALLATSALFASPALAQFPQTLPANTVWGRLGVSSGPGQAIPFATLQARLLQAVTVQNGNTDDCAAIQAAFNAGNLTVSLVGGLTYSNCKTKLTIPARGALYGNSAILVKAANIDMIEIGASHVELHDLNLQGVGGTFTGRGIICGAASNQNLINVDVEDMNGYVLEVTANDACSLFTAQRGTWYRTTLTNPAVKLPTLDGASSGGDRRFISIDNAGGVGYDLAGSNMTFITNCDTAGLVFSNVNSRATTVTACRVSQTDTQIQGTFHKFTGNIWGGVGTSVELLAGSVDVGFANNEFAAAVLIDSGATNSRFAGNHYTAITDNSGNTSNIVLDSGQTGTGSAVRATSPTLVTPALGAATATTINGMALTTCTGPCTLTINNSQTLTVQNSGTLSGTAGWGLNITGAATLTLPTSGTSGGIPYYSGVNAISSSALLATNAVMVGGGAGNTPLTRSVWTIDSNSQLLGTNGSIASTAFKVAATASNFAGDYVGVNIGTTNTVTSASSTYYGNAFVNVIHFNSGSTSSVYNGTTFQTYVDVFSSASPGTVNAFNVVPSLNGASPTGTLGSWINFAIQGVTNASSGSPSMTVTAYDGLNIANAAAGSISGLTLATVRGIYVAGQVAGTSGYGIMVDTGSTTNAIYSKDTTDASSVSVASVRLDGGMGIAKKLFVGTTLNVIGSYQANGTPGVSTTCTVTAGNTLVYTFGILTSKGANCT